MVKSNSKVPPKSNLKWYIFSIILIMMVIIEFFLIFTIISVAPMCDLKTYTPLDSSLVSDNDISNISVCANSSVIDTSYCLNEIFKEIFSYNMTLDYEYDNFTNVDKYIRQYGGDCHDAATWYAKAARDLGLNSKYVDFTMSYDNSSTPIVRYMHAVAVIVDDDAYCIMDQGKALNCFEFLDDDVDEGDEDNATG